MRRLVLYLFFLLSVVTVCEAETTTDYKNENLSMSLSRRKIKKWAKDNAYNYIVVRDLTSLEANLKPKTIFDLRANIDLNNKEILLPKNCYVRFARYSVYNGKMLGVLLNPMVEVKSFGAYPNDMIDDYQAIQNACRISSGKIVFDSGKYYVSNILNVNNSNITIVGDETEIFITPRKSQDPGILISSCSNIEISGLSLYSDGRYASASKFSRPDGTLWSNVQGIVISNVNNINIHNLRFANLEYALKIDGRIGSNRDVYISDISTSDNVVMPIYISYTTNATIRKSHLCASKSASGYDHHIYACSQNENHLIEDCIFEGGSGIPIHYYNEDTTTNNNIRINNCKLFDTLGAIILSSQNAGNMSVSNLEILTDREYANGVIRSEGNNTLIVKDCTIDAKKQYLFSCTSTLTIIDSILADIKALQTALPKKGSSLRLENSKIILRDLKYMVYLSGANSNNLGNVDFISNDFTIKPNIDWLFSTRGISPVNFNVSNNVFRCEGGVKYAVYQAGASNPNFIFSDNTLYGCPLEKHSSVKDGVFKNNVIHK